MQRNPNPAISKAKARRSHTVTTRTALRRLYADYASWTDRGILADLRQYHQVENVTLRLLQTIAVCVVEVLHNDRLVLSRLEKSSREFLIGWFNMNYDLIRPIIPNVVIGDETGATRGPMADDFEQYCRDNPDSSLLRYLRDCQ
jgi:hypothetical protein